MSVKYITHTFNCLSLFMKAGTIRVALAFSILCILNISIAYASHDKGGVIEWQSWYYGPSNSTTLITPSLGLRKSFYSGDPTNLFIDLDGNTTIPLSSPWEITNEGMDWGVFKDTISATIATDSLVHEITYETCCRAGSLMEGNGDSSTIYSSEFIHGNFSSPQFAYIPIITAAVGEPLEFVWPITAGDNTNLRYSFTSVSRSGLVTAVPGSVVGSGANQILSLSEQGLFSWIDPPQAGLYAVSATLTYTPIGTTQDLRTTFEFIIDVQAAAPVPILEYRVGGEVTWTPFPTGENLQVNCYISLECIIELKTSGLASPDIVSTTLPNNAVFDQSCQLPASTNECIKTYRHTPQQLGSVPAAAFGFLIEGAGPSATQGLFTVQTNFQDKLLFFLSGTVRDFNLMNAPDFNVAAGSSVNDLVSLVGQQLILTSDSSALINANITSAESFSHWFVTVPMATINREFVRSITLGLFKGINVSIPNSSYIGDVYQIKTETFFPIDGVGYGDDFSISGLHRNGFFTYHINFSGYFNSELSSVIEFCAMGELWVFIDDNLAVDHGGQENTQRCTTVDLNALNESNLGAADINLYYSHRSYEITPGLAITMARQTVDTDLDDIPNNQDLDDDNDGTPDVSDAFPFDPTEDTDTDGDGIGDNTDTSFDIPDNNVNALIATINAANNESENPGLDIINLSTNGSYQLISIIDTTVGNTGLPAITSEIIIKGNGATITGTPDNNLCDGNGDEFRILLVSATGELTINNTTISNGCTFGVDGGGILVNGGLLNLNNSSVLDTTGQPDGGVYSNTGTVTISR
jgi:fibro-slime domain-containing protein